LIASIVALLAGAALVGYAQETMADTIPLCGFSQPISLPQFAEPNKLGGLLREAGYNGTGACASVGPQRAAVLLVRWPGDTEPATPVSTIREWFFGAAPSLATFWSESSYGKATLTGDVFGWFTVDARYTCNEVEEAALAAADSSVSLRDYNRIFVIWVKPPGCARANLGFGSACTTHHTPLSGTFDASISEFADSYLANRALMVGLAAHEGGHSIASGLAHASAIEAGSEPLGPPGQAGTIIDYGNPYSVMGANPLFQYDGIQKLWARWLDESTNLQTITSPGTYTIQPLESPPTGVKVLKIRRGASSDDWLWIDYRQPVGAYDSALPAAATGGASVYHWDTFTSLHGNVSIPGNSRLIDFTPQSAGSDFSDAMLFPGRTWKDPYSPLSLSVVSLNGSAMSVAVGYDNVCSTISDLKASQSGAGQGQIPVQAPAGCTWQARSNSSWITVDETPKSGSLTLTYQVQGNPNATARRGSITIDRQTVVIEQTGTNQVPSASITPASASGTSQTFQVTFADGDGYQNLFYNNIWFWLQSDRARYCVVDFWYSQSRIVLRADDGTFASSTFPGDTRTLTSGRCLLDLSRSSVSANGNNIVLNAAMTFTASMTGTLSIDLLATDNSSGQQSLRDAARFTVAVPVENCAAVIENINRLRITNSGFYHGYKSFDISIRYTVTNVGPEPIVKPFLLVQAVRTGTGTTVTLRTSSGTTECFPPGRKSYIALKDVLKPGESVTKLVGFDVGGFTGGFSVTVVYNRSGLP
jgi:M6 family metalloprotease-like protein